MTLSSEKRLAFQYGRQAAKQRKRFAPALDPKMQQPDMREGDYFDVLCRAWFRGYLMQIQSEAPEIGEAVAIILRELYGPTPVLEWSDQAREAKKQLEVYGI